jgi:1-acyl-sn-glycerol-3-phosphate acyltransferase
MAFAWMATTVVAGCSIGYVTRSLWLQKKCGHWTMGCLPTLNFTRLRVHYSDAFEHRRPSVFAFNHVNLMDASTACHAIPTAFSWHFKVPVYGWLMFLTHGIPVVANPLQRARELPGYFRRRAAQGLSILTFPEAHRTLDGTVGEFKRGVTQLACDAELPLVPVGVRGMFQIMRKGSKLVRPGGVVDVWVGPQFETKGLRKKEMEALTRHLEELVRTFVEEGRIPEVGDWRARLAHGSGAGR